MKTFWIKEEADKQTRQAALVCFKDIIRVEIKQDTLHSFIYCWTVSGFHFPLLTGEHSLTDIMEGIETIIRNRPTRTIYSIDDLAGLGKAERERREKMARNKQLIAAAAGKPELFAGYENATRFINIHDDRQAALQPSGYSIENGWIHLYILETEEDMCFGPQDWQPMPATGKEDQD